MRYNMNQKFIKMHQQKVDNIKPYETLDFGTITEMDLEEFADWQQWIESLNSDKCECGGEKLEFEHHYDWCPLYSEWKFRSKVSRN